MLFIFQEYLAEENIEAEVAKVLRTISLGKIYWLELQDNIPGQTSIATCDTEWPRLCLRANR